jgi:hypothetical protein
LFVRAATWGELGWSWFFAPSSLGLGEPAYKWREAQLMILAIKSCSMPSSKRGFQMFGAILEERFLKEDQENQHEGGSKDPRPQ